MTFELALEIAIGVFVGFFMPSLALLIMYDSKIFELYQRFTWLQKDIQKIATKTETEK